MAASQMGQSMSSYYNPYGSLNAASMAAAAAAAAQQSAMSASLGAPAQVIIVYMKLCR